MRNQPKVEWGGGHSFFVYDADLRTWNDVPDVYIFAGLNSMRTWQAKYIGQTKSFRNRMPPNHARWNEAQRMGATHIHAKVVHSASSRLDLEQLLINAYRPPLNGQ